WLAYRPLRPLRPRAAHRRMTGAQDVSVDPPSRGGALVTGAGRGLGFEIARRLVGRGHIVHVTDPHGEAAARPAKERGPRAFPPTLDVRSFAACRAAASRTQRRAGSLEVWVNNAGVLVTGPAWEQDQRTRELMLEVNATGTINGTLAALDPMRAAGRGHIVNVICLARLVAAP